MYIFVKKQRADWSVLVDPLALSLIKEEDIQIIITPSRTNSSYGALPCTCVWIPVRIDLGVLDPDPVLGMPIRIQEPKD